jgi:chromosomal replication initiation ATPase DnaA
MSQETQQFTELLKQVGTTAKVVGVEKLTEILKEVKKNYKDISPEQYQISQNVIKIVCEVYEISYDDFFDNKRKNMRKYALSIVCYVLNEIYKMDYEIISFIVKKSKGLISVLISDIKQLNKNHFQDKQTLVKLDKVLTLINN